eukprot:TRINITY_DN50_c0_g2_i1.p1 TRINITY_DN50_c0_g2~~TRINITY_DN50_c0_g2_i1.p1  ORF type:complete len:987 (-),score=233.87 TRINITY_DN50_c0_g2_i1:373-3333(-)
MLSSSSRIVCLFSLVIFVILPIFTVDVNAQQIVTSNDANTRKLAIVLPFVSKQVQNIHRMWTRWVQFPPCSPASPSPFPKPTLFLYFANSFSRNIGKYDSRTIQQTIMHFWKTEMSSVQTCFDDIRFLEANLSESIGHPDGPCRMFFSVFDLLPSDYQHMFWMEPDVLPIQQNWLERIQIESDQNYCEEFWEKGSCARCASWFASNAARQDLHLNGNALYCLGNPFRDYIRRVIAFYPSLNGHCAGCETGVNKYEGGFDHTLYRYRWHPHNFEEAQTIMSKFVYTDMIQNYCSNSYDANQIVKVTPQTVLVHSKWIFYTKEEKAVTNVWDKMQKFYQPPDPQMDRYVVHLQSGEITEDDVLREECVALKNKPPDVCPASTMLGLPTPWSKRFPGQLYMWTSDLHPAPIGCNLQLLHDIGVVTHAEIDFPLCSHFSLCPERLKLLKFDSWKGFSLDPCPRHFRREFFNAYKDDPEFQRVDFFICSHPVANCELYMPFNRPLIIYPTTRLEFGRNDDNIDWRQPYMQDMNQAAIRWKEWVLNVRAIAQRKNPPSIIAANNLYDLYYIKYMTGLDAQYLPSWCSGSHASVEDPNPAVFYAPTTNVVLIGPSRDNLDIGHCSSWKCDAWQHPMMKQLRHEIISFNGLHPDANITVSRLREYYDYSTTYSFKQLTGHKAFIMFPYQASTMTFFQLYRYNVPIFAPSYSFLQEWHQKYNFFWERIYGHPKRFFPFSSSSFTSPFPAYTSSSPSSSSPPIANAEQLSPFFDADRTLPVLIDEHTPSPNDNSAVAFAFWSQFFDIYVFPHIILFNSWAELVEKIYTTDLWQVSNNMKEFNKQHNDFLRNRWAEVLKKAASPISPPHLKPLVVGHSYEEAMQMQFGGTIADLADIDSDNHAFCISKNSTKLERLSFYLSSMERSSVLSVAFLLAFVLAVVSAIALWYFKWRQLSGPKRDFFDLYASKATPPATPVPSSVVAQQNNAFSRMRIHAL